MPDNLPARLTCTPNSNGPDWPCWLRNEAGIALATIPLNPDHCPEPAALGREIAKRWVDHESLLAILAEAKRFVLGEPLVRHTTPYGLIAEMTNFLRDVEARQP